MSSPQSVMVSSTGMHTFHIIDMSLNKNACDIAYIHPTALQLRSTYTPDITAYTCPEKLIYYATEVYMPTPNVQLTSHVPWEE